MIFRKIMILIICFTNILFAQQDIRKIQKLFSQYKNLFPSTTITHQVFKDGIDSSQKNLLNLKGAKDGIPLYQAINKNSFSSSDNKKNYTSFKVYFCKENGNYYPLNLSGNWEKDTAKAEMRGQKPFLRGDDPILNARDLWQGDIYKDVRDHLIKLLEAKNPSAFTAGSNNSIFNSVSTDTTDLNSIYNNWQRINNSYLYPDIKASSKDDYFVDLSFSQMNISRSNLFIVDNMIAGFKLSVKEEILALLPYQGLSLVLGPRLLFSLSSLEKSQGKITDKSSLLDLNILFRIPTDTRKFSFKPSFNFDEPKLNLGAAFGLDLIFSKFMDSFPAIRLTGFLGKQNYSNPLYENIYSNEKSSFFSFNQLMFTMSFFKSIQNENHRLKMDLGVVYYDVFKAVFNLDDKLLAKSMLQGKVKPIINIDYNLILTNNGEEQSVLGLTTKLFEERVNFLFWFKLWGITTSSDLRVETFYLTSPLFRDLREWENDGGTFFQLRWRGKF